MPELSTFAISSVAAGDRGAIEACRRLLVEYVSTLGVDLSFQNIEREMAEFPVGYVAPTGCLLLATRNGDELPVGCVGIRALSAGCCELKRLFVSPSMRGSGLGRALTERAMAEASSLEFDAMRLDTLPSMASARALYRAMGFAEIEPYYSTPIEGTAFMEIVLDGKSR